MLLNPVPSSQSRPPVESLAQGSDQGRRPSSLSIWLRVVLACGLLVAAGALRLWQERQVEARMASGLEQPFSLADLPDELGDWQGQADALDPYIARATGSIDNTLRSYVNRRTGVRLEVIVLYGPAVSMRIHAPELCYPSAGYEPVDDVLHHTVKTGGGPPDAQFRSLIYTRGEGGQSERQEVYYAWRYDGRWTPYVGGHKQVERIPAMYKLHVARSVAAGELRDEANPCQDFLERMVPEIERRLEEAASNG